MTHSNRTYLVVALAFLLIAGPWLQDTAAETLTPDHEDCTCCAAVATPSCCPMAAPESGKSKSEADDCPCHLAALPDIPDQPMEALVERIDAKSSVICKETVTVAPVNAIDQPRFIQDHAPPVSEAPPAYILHSAFLI